jgi:hypothetical protein
MGRMRVTLYPALAFSFEPSCVLRGSLALASQDEEKPVPE